MHALPCRAQSTLFLITSLSQWWGCYFSCYYTEPFPLMPRASHALSLSCSRKTWDFIQQTGVEVCGPIWGNFWCGLSLSFMTGILCCIADLSPFYFIAYVSNHGFLFVNWFEGMKCILIITLPDHFWYAPIGGGNIYGAFLCSKLIHLLWNWMLIILSTTTSVL